TPRLVQACASVAIVPLVGCLREVKQHFLPKGAQRVFAYSDVVPSAMHEQKLQEETKLGNRIIGSSCCLKSFSTRDTNTDMRFLYHGDIVGTISYGERD